MYTPSAYTLTNTTRPHELNAKRKTVSPILRIKRCHGRIGILAKEQTVHKNMNHRQAHTEEDKKAENRVILLVTSEKEIREIVTADSRSRCIDTQSNQSCPGSRACNPARSNTFHTQGALVAPSTIVSYTLAQNACTHTYTHTHNVHLITLNYT